MRKVLLFAGMSAFLFTSCVSNPDGDKAETTDAVETSTADGASLTVNPAASSVVWLGKKVSGEHTGDVQIKEGTITVQGGKLVGGKVVIDVTSLNDKDLEGEWKQKLEDHLKSADFFDVANHPEAILEITDVKDGAEAGTAVVSANLTIRGITKNITFNANVAEATATSFKGSADFNIEREDWDVKFAGKPDDLISKQINFKINLEAAAI
jgi:polyisoprenoid-binding protein YceI